MVDVRRRGAVLGVLCAMAVAMSAGFARAAPAAGAPAYGVEPGEAPKNSVPVGAQASGSTASTPAAPSAASGAPSAPPQAPGASTPAPPSTPDTAQTDMAAAPAPGEAGTTTSTEVSDQDPRALTDFRPELDPYGQWVEDPKYGLVWVPDRSVVGDGFSPYVTAGHWALDTESNWVWVSDYPFGEVVFHYGRWVWTGSYGWSWIPGYQYAPAWVVWRVPTADYAYVGWAPMPPLFVWWGGIGMSLWWGPPYYWAFCPSRFVFSHYTSYYVVHDRAFVRTLAGSTRRYVAAPRVTSAGPSLQAARVPSSALPSQRIPAAPGRMASSSALRATYPSSTARSYGPRPSLQGPSTSRVAPYAGQRGFPSTRTYSTAPRSPYSAAPRTMYSPPPRTYSPAPRSFSSPAPTYSAAPRAYSPSYSAAPRTYSPSYSAAPRVYSPAPRVYSAPHYSAPSYNVPSYHPSYSAPHVSSPHFSGGGGHHR